MMSLVGTLAQPIHAARVDASRLSSRSRVASVARLTSRPGRAVNNKNRQLPLTVQDALSLRFAGDGSCNHLYDDPRDCPEIPQDIPLTPGVTVIGRVIDVDNPELTRVVVPIATVSGTHCAFEVLDSGVWLTDLGSTNGTFVDNRELVPNDAQKVQVGSEIIFGDQYLAKFTLTETK